MHNKTGKVKAKAEVLESRSTLKLPVIGSSEISTCLVTQA